MDWNGLKWTLGLVINSISNRCIRIRYACECVWMVPISFQVSPWTEGHRTEERMGKRYTFVWIDVTFQERFYSRLVTDLNRWPFSVTIEPVPFLPGNWNSCAHGLCPLDGAVEWLSHCIVSYITSTAFHHAIWSVSESAKNIHNTLCMHPASQ